MTGTPPGPGGGTARAAAVLASMRRGDVGPQAARDGLLRVYGLLAAMHPGLVLPPPPGR